MARSAPTGIYDPMANIISDAAQDAYARVTRAQFKEKTMTMNGPTILGTSAKPLLNESQLACVDLLREALKEAEDGNVSACGIIVCMDGGFASVMAGTKAGDLNLGCDDLKRKILDAVTTGNVARPKGRRDTILRVK